MTNFGKFQIVEKSKAYVVQFTPNDRKLMQNMPTVGFGPCALTDAKNACERLLRELTDFGTMTYVRCREPETSKAIHSDPPLWFETY